MSMNFGREQSLLKQQLTACATPETAAAAAAGLGAGITCLGAPSDAVVQAAQELLGRFPQMGRAQMTAFARTLWQSKVQELRAVATEILATRVALLEAADAGIVQQMAADQGSGPIGIDLGRRVLGELVTKHKKLWKDLEKLAASGTVHAGCVALAACRAALVADATAFPRFAKVAAKLLPNAEPAVLTALSEVLANSVGRASAEAQAFAAAHGINLPTPTSKRAKAK